MSEKHAPSSHSHACYLVSLVLRATRMPHRHRTLVLPRFCPFRFMHGDKINEEGAAASGNPDQVPVKQPPPPMFSLGRHMCPGRELAKLEMLLFLKEFLTKFDYELVEGQSFKGVLPVNEPKDKLRVILKLKSAT